MSLPIVRLWLCAQVTVFALLIGFTAAQAQAQNSVPGMPAGWETLPPDQLAAAASSYLETPPWPTVSDAAPVIQHVWDRYLVDDAHSAPLSNSTLLKLLGLMQNRETWLTVPPGVDPTTRIAALSAAQRESLTQNPTQATSLDFSALLALWEEGSPATLAQPNEVAQIYATWMGSHDWQSLSLVQKSQLAVLLAGDQLNERDFSARWTGTLTPNAGGDYRFGQLRHFSFDGTCKVSVNEALVYDTSTATAPEGQDSLLGQSVTLTAGQPVSLKVEYIYQAPPLQVGDVQYWDLPQTYPMLVLTWQTPAGAVEVVPSSALTPPQEHAQQGAHGLWGDYFSGSTGVTESGSPLASRLDANLGFVWTLAPILPTQPTQLAAVTQDLFQQLTQAETIDPEWWFRVIPYTSGLGTISQRQQVLAKLQSQPGVLATVPPRLFFFGKSVRELVMLSSSARQWLLRTWASPHPALYKKLDDVPSHWMYWNVNHLGYWNLAFWYSGPYGHDLDQIIQNGLADENGRPYIGLIGIAAHHSSWVGRYGQFRDWVRNQVDAQTPVGDLRAQWLLAQGLVEEVGFSPVAGTREYLNPAVALPFLEEALQAAESPEVKFDLLTEIIIRQIGLGECDQALARINSATDQFTSDDQKTLLTYLQTTAQNYGPLFTAYVAESAAKQAQAAQTAYINELQARIDAAQQRGDSALASKYQEQLRQAQQ